MMPHIYGYGRRSDPRKQQYSIEVQEDEIHQAALRIAGRGLFTTNGLVYRGREDIYTDDISTMRVHWTKRPSMLALMDKMEPGDHLVVVDNSRLHRTVKEAIEFLEDVQKYDIHLHILRASGDSVVEVGTPASILSWQVLAAAAEFFRNELSQKVKAKVKHAVAMRRCHTGQHRYGYRRVPLDLGDGKTRPEHIVDCNEMDLIREIWTKRGHFGGKKTPIRTIAAQFNARNIDRSDCDWSKSTIARIERWIVAAEKWGPGIRASLAEGYGYEEIGERLLPHWESEFRNSSHPAAKARHLAEFYTEFNFLPPVEEGPKNEDRARDS